MSDVLIVGAGSAGSVLAERLSADQSRTVTLLESGTGPDDPVAAALIADAFQLPIGQAGPVARHYRTLLTDRPPRPADIVRGDCVGGSGAINGGYFCRAAPADFGWAPGWSWAEVRPHYRAVEDRIPLARASRMRGPTEAFAAAAAAAGYRWLPDLNAEPAGSNAPPGIGAVPLNIAAGSRISTASAFLIPALDRPNLTLLTGVRATGVAVRSGRAVGVDAVGPGGPRRLAADQVVLSAGAIESARLLMLSGIGPAVGLRALGIAPIADLPVGQHFCDHPEWLLGAGWAGLDGHPVLEIVLVEGDLEVRPYTRGFDTPKPGIGVALMRPGSRGRISLASADPGVPPRIEHRYDADPADAAHLQRGRVLVEELLRGRTELGEPQWSTSQHLCGTAPIGAPGDPRAVVDPRCRVHGVAGLSVVDGSVLPRIPGRGPHATIAMLAHRAAEFF